MPRPVSSTKSVSTIAARAAIPSGHAPAGLGELHRVREQVPDDLLHAVGVAHHPRRVGRRTACSIAIPLRARRPATTTSIAVSATVAEIDRLHLEPQLAAHDPRHVEHVVDQAGLRDGVAVDDLRARASASPDRPGAPSRILVQPSTALSGVRISCDSVARNSSLTRTASSATARAVSAVSIWWRSSRSLATRSLTSSMTVMVPTMRAVDLERRDARALRALGQPGARGDAGSGESDAPARATRPRARRGSATSKPRVTRSGNDLEAAAGRRRPPAASPVCCSSQRFQLRITRPASVVKMPCVGELVEPAQHRGGQEVRRGQAGRSRAALAAAPSPRPPGSADRATRRSAR